MPGKRDITGERIGKHLVAIRYVGNRRGFRAWELRCDCGGTKTLDMAAICRIRTKNSNAGCDDCDSTRRSERQSTHGQSPAANPTRLYRIWSCMRTRCKNKKNTGYKDYGGRGILISKGWDNFEGFRDWAMSHGYADDLTIDRVDPDYHYDPSNCEWVPMQVNLWRRNHPGYYWRSMTCDA